MDLGTELEELDELEVLTLRLSLGVSFSFSTGVKKCNFFSFPPKKTNLHNAAASRQLHIARLQHLEDFHSFLLRVPPKDTPPILPLIYSKHEAIYSSFLSFSSLRKESTSSYLQHDAALSC